MSQNRRTLLKVLGFAAATIFSAMPVAADFPTREVRFVVPWGPGGSNDIMVRFIQPLIEKQGVKIVVENVAGGTGAIGMGQVATSKPDGHTVGMGTSSTLSVMAQNKVPLKMEQFTNLVRLSEDPLIIVVPGKSPHKSLKDFMAHLKANAGKVTIGTPGSNNINHIFAAMTARGAGVGYRQVSYPGGSRVIAELMGGQVEAGVLKPSETMQQIKAGDLRPLGVFSSKRLAVLPDVPTFAEVGVDVFPFGTVRQMSYVSGPANLDPAAKAKLITAFQAVVKGPEFQKFAGENGFVADGLAGDALEKEVKEIGSAVAEVAKQVLSKQ